MDDAPGPESDQELEIAPKPVPMTEDGIPMEVNGRALNDIEIQALREARDRRGAETIASSPTEVGGAARETDPTRYGDWEKAGRAVDFS